MRFRARLSQENVNILIGISNLMERIGKTAVVYLTAEFFRIAVVTDDPDTPKLFSELKQENMFLDYRIESQSDNTILFEIGLNHFSRALLSGRNASICLLKLVKRDSKPNLCIETRSLEALVVDIVHDLPIKILKPSDIVYYMPPIVPPPLV
eukprot:gene366-452_t